MADKAGGTNKKGRSSPSPSYRNLLWRNQQLQTWVSGRVQSAKCKSKNQPDSPFSLGSSGLTASLSSLSLMSKFSFFFSAGCSCSTSGRLASLSYISSAGEFDLLRLGGDSTDPLECARFPCTFDFSGSGSKSEVSDSDKGFLGFDFFLPSSESESSRNPSRLSLE